MIIKYEGVELCSLCGEFKETRPYGPNGERICFDCGMKDEAAAKRQFHKRLFQETDK